MKGLVLSGGYGTGVRPLTYSQQKQLIPVANKPILFYTIEDLISAGIKDIGIVVGPNKEQVIKAVESKKWDANFTFINQPQPLGLAHAIKISENFLENNNFVMYLGDNILKGGIAEYVKEFSKSEEDAFILLTEVENPQRFGVAQLDKNGNVIKLIEKPKSPPSNLALVGIYMFKPIVFEAVKNIKPSWRNELEITDAIQWLIDKGYKVKAKIVKGWWKDTGRPEDILDANRLVLDEIERDIRGNVEEGCVIKGRVKIGEGSVIKGNSVLKGPCIVGNNCLIENSFIGPYTSIGNECKIINSEIEDSIIMDGSEIDSAGRIIDSLIGKEVSITKDSKIIKGFKLVLGDKSKVLI
ncbi:MAG: glucose-1-phosphate thymidylyltransferase [Candidatus Aenigmatarchaeota archaeon]